METAVPTAATSQILAYDPDLWQRGYESLAQEYDYWIEDIDGEIPPDLQGTLFRNGPGLLEINGDRLRHPFDGDGMVCAITLTAGKAHFRNRYVRTEGFVAEQAAGRILYRGVFGTRKPGGWLANLLDQRLKNIANTQVIYWGDRLLALWEAALPYRLDPATLETLGTETLNGVLADSKAFAAHPWIDPGTADQEPRLVNFSLKPGLSTTITVYELDLAGQVLTHHRHTTPGFAFIHDFAITPHYCLFLQSPIQLNPLPYLLGLRGPGECLKFRRDRLTRVLVVPRKQPAAMQTLEVQTGFVFHHVNAFEQGETIVLDSIVYDDFPTVEPDRDFRQVEFAALPPGQLWRFHLNLTGQTVTARRLAERCCEFPALHPQRVGRPYSTAYLGAAHDPTGNAPLQAIWKLNLESGAQDLWSAAPHGFVGEPVFVPHPGTGAEDEGWLLTLVYDGDHHRTDVVILDAQDLSRGPLARLHLKHHVPYGLHGSFTPKIFLESATVAT